ncbi:MAG: hypothetical protein HKN56_07055 [Gammaproteobacteria bacterium]|nr:hypothetical protein [Gammaproteobacteria bacterium]NND54712.1 hypothetical protein [Gammaproteobacteria bacterium]
MSSIIERTTLLVRDKEITRRWREQVHEIYAYYDDNLVVLYHLTGAA